MLYSLHSHHESSVFKYFRFHQHNQNILLNGLASAQQAEGTAYSNITCRWCCKFFATGTIFFMKPIQSLTTRLFSFILSRIGSNMAESSTGVSPAITKFECVQRVNCPGYFFWRKIFRLWTIRIVDQNAGYWWCRQGVIWLSVLSESFLQDQRPSEFLHEKILSVQVA